jgi:YesN/AraC family two-component response regulator
VNIGAIPTMNNIDNCVTKIGFIDEIIPYNSGFFVSRGLNCHPQRIITSYEIIFVVQGQLDIEENGIAYTVLENQVLVLTPGVMHRGTKTYPKDLKYYWLHFSTTYTGINYRNDQMFKLSKVSTILRPSRLVQLFNWYISDQENFSQLDKTAKLVIYLIFSEIEQASTIKSVEMSAINYHARKAYEIIQTEYCKDLSTKNIAEQLHCNSDYLGRVFKKAYGIPLTKQIHLTRIKKGKQLLVENSMNISEIAFKVGFRNVGHFRAVFKRNVGVTPTAFRYSYNKIHINTE